ncbi:telomere repeat-binding factor 1-like [Ipomoea triloba]|uniref:telomere repeat-binding factor 1-like n=1 Tax=Ipomoea triloba TaxID=35885 RepID=UPI00125E7069|nr:telomere repeat-binding factor 1-like [Ipomoea triloba]XP_031115058.1 telomere repeat-binding factor 1-like [Ipomoea triloba]XP_031115059.1 telomere repeat-binding factor 1-like [Ipomoea triloba]
MGAPKQKWTSEEEAALKAGVSKYGVGKWSTILKDPEFAAVLCTRSNVDLKDKWRNLHVMANGWGSRQRGKIVYKGTQSTPKHEDNSMALIPVVENDMEVIDAKPLVSTCETLQAVHPKKPISSLDDLILEAIVKLKEPRGSSRSSISLYIEEHYAAPPNLERLLAANLKVLTENGRLVKVKHQYRIPPSRVQLSINVKVEPSTFPLGGKQMHYLKPEKNATRILTKAQIDAELEKMKNMTAQEAAAAAAQAVAEAEAAIADAEQAAREAEEAEAEAEAAQSLAEATSKALIFQSSDYPRLIKPIF